MLSSGSMAWGDFIRLMIVTVVSGMVISGVYLYFKKKQHLFSELGIVIAVIPVTTAIVIRMSAYNIAAVLTLIGVFALLRFRNALIDTKDLSYLFISIACGILSGCGFMDYAILFAVVLLILLILLEKMGWGFSREDTMLLKIWVPESLNFQGVFEPILEEYTEEYCLLMVRTTDFGSTCELRYRIVCKKEISKKQMMDEIRVRNGNLNVVLVVAPQIVERNSKQIL